MEQKFRDWTMKECIGEGAFGKVYRIEREDFGHTYQAALKVIQIPLHPGDVDSAINEGMTRANITEYFYGMVEKIVEEFVLMSKLKGNSNIVSYEDHYVEKNKNGFGWTIYIRMELLTPLYKYIRENNLKIKDVIQLGIDMCHALEICQKFNIIHRDIKPENIFVSELGDFKLGDFGIARELEKTTSNLSKVGTKAYMAPEVFKGYSYNSNVDIYSLGIVMYRFLNRNRLPFMPAYPKPIKFSDKERAEMLRMSGQTVPNPCNAKGRLAEIVIKACEYNPKDRYDSAGEMRRALEEILYSDRDVRNIYPDGEDELEFSGTGSGSTGKSVSPKSTGIDSSRSDRVNPGKNPAVLKDDDKGKESVNKIQTAGNEGEGTRYLFHDDKTVKGEQGKRQEDGGTEKKGAGGTKLSEEEPPKPEILMPPEGLKSEETPAVDVKKIRKKMKEIEKGSSGKNRKHYFLVGGAAALLLVIGLVFAVKGFSGQEEEVKKKVEASQTSKQSVVTSTPETTATPAAVTEPPSYKLVNVVNQPRSQAGEALRKQTKAKIAVTHQYSEKIKKGNVISQNPAAGTVFYNTDDTANYKVLQKISLVISKGSEYVTMPDLENKTLAGAKKKLKKLGLKVKVNSSLNSSYIKSGRVMYQSILSGKKVKKGTTITLTPSKGPAPVTYTNTATQSNSSSSTNRSSSSSSRRSSSSSSKKSSSSSKSSKSKNSSDFSSEDDARIVD